MSMADILIKAASFASIILLGYLLRRKGFFKEEDFYVLSKIVLKITLPAAIVYNFSTMEIDVSMLSICLFGFAGGVVLMGVIWLLNTGKPKERKGFEVLNVAGYNIGNFTMPFIQGFLGTTGLAAASLFDTGNSFICLGRSLQPGAGGSPDRTETDLEGFGKTAAKIGSISGLHDYDGSDFVRDPPASHCSKFCPDHRRRQRVSGPSYGGSRLQAEFREREAGFDYPDSDGEIRNFGTSGSGVLLVCSL